MHSYCKWQFHKICIITDRNCTNNEFWYVEKIVTIVITDFILPYYFMVDLAM